MVRIDKGSLATLLAMMVVGDEMVHRDEVGVVLPPRKPDSTPMVRSQAYKDRKKKSSKKTINRRKRRGY